MSNSSLNVSNCFWTKWNNIMIVWNSWLFTLFFWIIISCFRIFLSSCIVYIQSTWTNIQWWLAHWSTVFDALISNCKIIWACKCLNISMSFSSICCSTFEFLNYLSLKVNVWCILIEDLSITPMLRFKWCINNILLSIILSTNITFILFLDFTYV